MCVEIVCNGVRANSIKELHEIINSPVIVNVEMTDKPIAITESACLCIVDLDKTLKRAGFEVIQGTAEGFPMDLPTDVAICKKKKEASNSGISQEEIDSGTSN